MAVYDIPAITSVTKSFMEMRKNDTKPITVLFDADNTLYQFSTYGETHVATSKMYTKYYFKNLRIFEEAPNVILNLQRLGIRCGIITRCINSPFCKTEKKESFEYYFPMIDAKDIYLLNEDEDKHSVIKDISHTILVDDYYVNINDWYKHGGIAIKKSYSGKLRPVPVVTSLVDLFSVLHELNVY